MNQGINCDVTECKYQDSSESNCTLKDIKVGTTSSVVTEKSDTGCMSFEKDR